ncbi:MAG: PIG-L family deacetylase [Luteimonas sp.]
MSDLEATTLTSLIGHATRVVIVSPHPDDEVLGCGGLMAMLAETGIPVIVLSVTDGERCYPSDIAGFEHMRRVRRDELLEASGILGITGDGLRFFGIPDSDAASHLTRMADLIQPVLAPNDIVFAPWRFDGHPDHEAVYRATTIAAAVVGCQVVEYPIWGWHWANPHQMEALSAPPVSLPISKAAQARKRAAIACFRSQWDEAHAPNAQPILPPAVLVRFARDKELFFK